MSVLTARSSATFSRQLQLPFALLPQPATKGMLGTGSAGPSHEPPWGVAKARSDKPGGP